MRFFNITPLMHTFNGDRTRLILPDECFSLSFQIQERAVPVRHSFRFLGEPDYFWKLRTEPGSPYCISMSIEDALTSQDTPREKYALKIPCHREKYEKNVYIKLKRGAFSTAVPSLFRCFAKGEGLAFGAGGEAVVELGIYRAKEGRHPDDQFDLPDETVRLFLTPEMDSWVELQQEFVMPQDAVSLLVRIGIKNAEGTLFFGSPRLYGQGMDNVIPPLDHTQSRFPEYNYIGENVSRRDWPEFRILVDGKTIFQGKKYTSIYRRGEFEIPAGVLEPGEHRLEVFLCADYESAVGFLFQKVELFEYGNREFEIIAAPEYAKENLPLKVLAATNQPDLAIHWHGGETVLPEPGLHVLTLPPIPAGVCQKEITLVSAHASDSFTVIQSVRGADDGVRLSTSDAVFIHQDRESFQNYLEWYRQNQVGNLMAFRPAYRWSGSTECDPEVWAMLQKYLNALGMDYTLILDGRELPGKNANPPPGMLSGPHFHGRQSHENDGSFCYWGNQLWKKEPLPEPYADLLARGIDKGGIQPHVRPKRTDQGAWWFFDPYKAHDLKEAAEDFIRNLADARGDSTRHSGPSVLFRYFFQAGYDYLLAEQMYGPEEFVLAALRGASSAYQAKGFGTHNATQWSSTPHDTPEHAERYFLSLATAYINGAGDINVEEGLWRMEKGYVDYDRYSRNCLRHLEAHTRFRKYLETHTRRGRMCLPFAILQGQYDGWNMFADQAPLWLREGEMWKPGSAEKSFQLCKLLLPLNELHSIYKPQCPVAPCGWYSGTPYGAFDLAPCETDWNRYRYLVFLGWNTWSDEQGRKMAAFVENGGHLLLSKRHLSQSLLHNGEGVYAPHPLLSHLLGPDWMTQTGLSRRCCGKGSVVYFAADLYPADIPELYRAEMRSFLDKMIEEEQGRGWMCGGNAVETPAWDLATGERVFYLLNIRWWDRKTEAADLLIGDCRYQVEVPYGAIYSLTVNAGRGILPLDPMAEILALQPGEAVIQSACAGKCLIFAHGAVRMAEYPAGISTIN